MIFIWEGAVASLPDRWVVQTMESAKRAVKAWDQALGYWEVHPWALNLMWSLLVRTTHRIDICVTTRPVEFAQALARRCEQENWPVRYVFAEAASALGRRLVAMPDVVRVYYGLEEQQFSYGPHGFFVSPTVPLTVS
jgi:hypothetical protein